MRTYLLLIVTLVLAGLMVAAPTLWDEEQPLPRPSAAKPAPDGPTTPEGLPRRWYNSETVQQQVFNDAQFELNEIEWNFGRVPPGTLHTKTFTVRNRGAVAGAITRVESSCGCTVVDQELLLGKEILPGSEMPVAVTINTTGKRHQFAQYVHLDTTDRKRPRLTIAITGFVLEGEQKPGVEVEPALWDLGVFEVAQTPTVTVTVHNRLDGDLTLVRVQNAAPLKRPVPLPAHSSTPVSVTLMPQFTPGVVRQPIALHVNPVVPGKLTIEARGYAIGARGPRLMLARDLLDVGVIESGAPAPSWSVAMTNIGDETGVLREVQVVRNEGERVLLVRTPQAPLKPGAQALVELALSPQAQPGLIDVLILFKSDALDNRQQSLVVHGFLAPKDGGRAALAPSKRLVFLYFSDLLGALSACDCHEHQAGGLDRLVSAIERERRAGPAPFVFSGGDFLGADTTDQAQARGRAIVDALAVIGMDAVVAGDRELALGGEFYETQVRAKLPLLQSTQEEIPLGETPFRVIERNGVRVAVFSLYPERFPAPVMHKNWKAMLDQWLPIAGEQSDFQVALSHLGQAQSHQVAAAAPALDLILVSHESELVFNAPMIFGQTLVTACSEKGRGLIRLEVFLDQDNKLLGWNQYHRALTSVYEPDLRVSSIIERYRREIAHLDLPEQPSTGLSMVGDERCRDCHGAQHKIWRASAHAQRAYSDLEKTQDQHDPECLRCHVTGLTARGGFRSTTETPAFARIGCEQCHGAGEAHVADRVADAPQGTTMPLKPDQTLCRSCHAPEHSPFFDYGRYWPKIEHGR